MESMKSQNQRRIINVWHNVDDLKTSDYYLLESLKEFRLIDNNLKYLHNGEHLKSNESLELVLFNHYIINILFYNQLPVP